MLALAAILFATLTPGPPRWTPFNPWCLTCGDRDLADALLNVILFAPFGLALSYAGMRRQNALMTSLVLSVAVEVAQAIVPGRDPSLRDVLMNTIGSALGFLIAGGTGTWLTPSPVVAARLSLTAAGAGFIIMVASGLLLSPSWPKAAYYAQWTQEREHQETYRGRVLDARLDSLRLPSARLESPETVRELLRAGAPIRVTVLAGPPPSTSAPIFGIADDRAREVMTIAATRTDVILRLRWRSSDLGLDLPELRVEGILRPVAPGDTFAMRLRRADSGYCFTVNQTERCHLGFTVAAGWRVLYSGRYFPRWLLGLYNLAWMASLFFPVGFWCRRALLSLLAVGLAVTGLVLPSTIASLYAPTLADWSSAVGGLLAGVVVAWVIRLLESRRGEATVAAGELPELAG